MGKGRMHILRVDMEIDNKVELGEEL